jgi:predicted MPP superfamily phosphohydrolase
VQDLTNQGIWFKKGERRIRLCGVDDFWLGAPDADAALADASPEDAVFMLSHNPDFLETLIDPRVTLALCGHTHGGQIRIPGFGAPVLPSQYGQKYAYGLVKAPHTRVLVTSGVGTVVVPARFCCPPEIVEIELHPISSDLS